MSGVYDDIETAFDNSLFTFTSNVPIAWRNTGYVPVVGTAFIKPTLLTGPSAQSSLGTDGLNRLSGIYQVSLFYPAGTGDGAARVKADAVISHFKRGTKLTQNGVTVVIERAYPSNAPEDPVWFHIPISVDWRVDHANV